MKRYLNVGQPTCALRRVRVRHLRYRSVHRCRFPVGGSDFASFLVGMGTVAGLPKPNNGYPNFSKDIFAAEASPYYAAFVEDTYHPTKTLTITAGLRWDIFGGRTERHNRLEYFNPNATNTASGVSYTGAEVYVNGGNRSPFTTNLKNFGPRLGFRLAAGQAPGRARRRRLLLRSQHANGRERPVEQRWVLFQYAMGRHLLERRRQYGL